MTVIFRGREMNMNAGLVEAFVPQGETKVHYFVEGRLLGTADDIRRFVDMAEEETEKDRLLAEARAKRNSAAG